MNSEKIKDILVIILLIFSIIFFLYCLLFVKEVTLYSENEKNEITESEEHNLDNMEVTSDVFVDNMNVLFEKYTGELSRITVSKTIRNICLKEIYNLKKIEISKSYFDNNYKNIVTTYGIQNYNDFKALYDLIQNYENKVTKISIIDNTVVVGENKTSFKVNITFETENIVTLKFVINNNISTNTLDNPNITVLAQE